MSAAITIYGNLAEAPKLATTTSGKATVRMRVAVDSRHRDAAGEWVDGQTSWYTVIAWDRLAENLADVAGKGDRLIVTGRLEEREWTTDAGEKRSVWELTAEDAGLSLRMPARGGIAAGWDERAEDTGAAKTVEDRTVGARRWDASKAGSRS